MRTSTTVRLALAAFLVSLAACGGSTAQAAPTVTAPGAPRSVSAVQYGSGGAKVSWKAPTSNGGAAITGYVVTPYMEGAVRPAVTFNGTPTSRVVRPLQNGKHYRFKVAARNAVGVGATSTWSSPIVVGAPGQPSILWVKPAANRRDVVQVRVNRGIVNAGNGALVLRLDATCTSSNGGTTRTGRMTAPKGEETNMNPWVMVGRLTLGKTYKCTVTATNSRGAGIRSKPSAAITV